MHSQSVTFCRRRSAVSLLGGGGEISAAEVSIVLLKTGSAEKRFLATCKHAYLKNPDLFNSMLHLGFFYHFSLPSDRRLYWLLSDPHS